jgi:hypothetical protein
MGPLIACLLRGTPHMGTIPYLQRTSLPIFLDFALCGPGELLPLSQSRQSVSARMSKADSPSYLKIATR